MKPTPASLPVLLLFGAAPAHAIYGGRAVEPCAWPNVVQLGECTGTLIHPELVLYAAHCGEDIDSVVFGESTASPARRVPVAECHSFPASDEPTGEDFAYCRLAEPQDVPIVPAISERELAALHPGTRVAIVGFGFTEEGTLGEKHAAETSLRCLTPGDEALAGGAGADACTGDSGGPAFVRLFAGGEERWRLFGVASRGTACGRGGYYGLVPRAIAWIEDDTGVDLTPCYQDGAWIGGCADVPASPELGEGAWSASCHGTHAPARSMECTEDAPEIDDVAPSLRIVRREELPAYDLDTGTAMLELEVEAIDAPGGCGLGTITVVVDGEPRAPVSPNLHQTRVVVPLGPGAHEIALRARDLAGNQSASESVQLEVELELVLGGGCAAVPGRGSADVLLLLLAWSTLAARCRPAAPGRSWRWPSRR